MDWIIALALAATPSPSPAVLDALCNQACASGGWAEGYARGTDCVCSDPIPMERILAPRVNLPGRIQTVSPY